MIYEERIYAIKPGHIPAYLKNYEENGYPIQQEYLGTLIGFFFTEIGSLNTVVHIWAYESLDDRQERRAKMAADQRWQEYQKTNTAHVDKQENRILTPTSFSPLQ